MNKENGLTRNQIQQMYIDWFIDSCNLKELIEIVANQMSDDLDMLDDVELVKEVKHYAPDLIEGKTFLI